MPTKSALPRIAANPTHRCHRVAGEVLSIGMTVSDADRSAAFYHDVLGFKKVGEMELSGAEFEMLNNLSGARARQVRMQLGDETLELTEFTSPRGRPMPADSRSNDHWFQHVAIIVGDMDEAYAHLRSFRVEHASPGPQRLPNWNRAAGGIRAFYFRDPDGHFLEILHFPNDKGRPKWRRKSDGLFLGIDHTAMVVSATQDSLAFYRDLLGMQIVGTSENYGPEQERLNAVGGARLRITTLRTPPREFEVGLEEHGPGIELLEYLAPRDGRPRPFNARPNDLLHWQTTIAVSCLESAADSLRQAQSRFVSSRAATVSIHGGAGEGLLVQDPDGHVVQLVECSH